MGFSYFLRNAHRYDREQPLCGMLYGDVAIGGLFEYRCLQYKKITLVALCRGLHFLAVQKDEEADQCNGLWLMMDRELPSI